GIGVCALILLILCGGTLFSDRRYVFNEFEHVFGTALALAAFGATTVLNLANIGRNDRRYFRWVGLITGLIGFFVALAWIFSQDHSVDLGRITVALGSIAAISGLLNAFLLVPLVGPQV